MKWLLALSALVIFVEAGYSQEAAPVGKTDSPSIVLSETPAVIFAPTQESTFLKGNSSFPNFIGFMSDPIQNIDPRAVTEIIPIFGDAWVSAKNRFLPSGDLQVYGPASHRRPIGPIVCRHESRGICGCTL